MKGAAQNTVFALGMSHKGTQFLQMIIGDTAGQDWNTRTYLPDSAAGEWLDFSCFSTCVTAFSFVRYGHSATMCHPGAVWQWPARV